MPLDSATKDDFPQVTFPVIEIAASISARFALKNPDDRAKAKRAMDAARKMLADAGADVATVFTDPVKAGGAS